MGVHRYDYLLLGWKMKSEILDQKFRSDLQFDAPDNFFFPEDGGCAVYGKVLEHSDYVTGFDLLELDYRKTVMYLEDFDALTSTFRNATGEELLDWTEHDLAKLYLFSMLQ